MEKKAKRTSTERIPGALSGFEICGRAHDAKFSGSHQNTSVRDEGKDVIMRMAIGYPARMLTALLL